MANGSVISIIVPVYQVEKYIGRCISSLLKQEFRNFEIICVDDGTKDESCTIIEEFMKADSRIRLVHKENGGLSSARNEGLKYADGEYVWFVDSDDFVTPDACSIINREIQEHRSDIITFGAMPIPEVAADKWLKRVLAPGYWVIEDKKADDTSSYADLFKTAASKRPLYDSMRAFVRFNGSWPFVWRCAFKRAFLKEKGLKFDESVKFGEDTVFLAEAYPQTRRISFLPSKLYYYRCARKGSLMDTNSDKYVRMAEHCKITKKVLDYWKEQGWSEEYGDFCLEWLIHFIGYDTIMLDRRYRKRFCRIEGEMISRYDLDRFWSKLPFYEKTVYTRIQLFKH